MTTKQRPLWRCPKCGERFITANMWHTCGRFTLKDLFSRSEPSVQRLFRRFARMVRACGPVRMIPQKSRVVFQVRVRFAGCQPRKSYLVCSVALPRRVENPRFTKITPYGRYFVGHQFHIHRETELDEEVQSWLHESYRVGAQESANH